VKSVDAAIALLLVVCGLGIGATYVGAARRTQALPQEPAFNQKVFGAALMSVCARGGRSPVLVTSAPDTTASDRALVDFLAKRQETLTCGQIPADVRREDLDGMQRASRYLILLAATAWSVSGPTWVGIDRLLGIMFGLSVALAYLTCRVTMNRFVSAAVALLFMLSPLQLVNAGDLRDYAKAPFFLATMLIVALLVAHRRAPSVVLGLAAAAGVVLGFGFGVRTDIAINLVVVIGAIVGFLAMPMRESWKLRIGASALCVAMFLAVALPVVRSGESGSNIWHWALLGYAHEWDNALGIAPGPYEPSYFYNDSYVASSVDAYWGRVTGSPAHLSVGLPKYPVASRAYYMSILSTFPADAMLRAWAAMIKILELPYSGLQTMSYGLLPDFLSRAIRVMQIVLSYLAPGALLLFGAVILGVSGRSVRLAVLMFGLAAFLGAYPAIQFQRRHIFHLEFLSLWILGFAVSQVWSSIASGERTTQPVWRIQRPALLIVAIAAFVAVPLATLRAYQDRSATALFSTYEGARLQRIQAAPEALGEGLALMAAGVDVLSRPLDNRSMYSDMLVAELSADRCAVDRTVLTFRYKAKDPSVDFTRTYNVDVPPAGASTRVYFPVLRTGPASPDSDLLTFRGLEVAESEWSCVKSISRFAEPDRFALLLPAVLRAAWRDRPLRQTLRGWERDPLRESAQPLSYWAPMSLRNQGAVLVARSVTAAQGIAADVDYRARIATVVGNSGVSVNGSADAPGSNLVAWKAQHLEASMVVVAEGVLDQGGVTVGLVDMKGWSSRVDIDTPGAFRVFVQPPHAGSYQIVIANHLSDAALRNRLVISRLAVLNGGHE
jgi:hypothetical protein